MKRPLFVLLTGLVLGEALAYVSGEKGVFIMALFMLAALGCYLGCKLRQSHFVFCQGFASAVWLVLFLLSGSGFLGGIFICREAYPGVGELRLITEGKQKHTEVNQISEKETAMGFQGQIVSIRWREEGTSQVVLKHVTLYPDTGRTPDTDQIVVSEKSSDQSLQKAGQIHGKSMKYKSNILVRLSLPDEEALLPEDWIRGSGEARLLESATNPGEFDSRSYYLAQGIRLQIQGEDWQLTERSLFSIRAAAYHLKLQIGKVYRQAMSKEEAALLKAIALGDKSDLSEEQRTVYSQNGVAHLLAVSGLHVSILGGILFRRMRKRGFRYITSCLTGSFILLFYGCLTGFGSSAARAIIMYLVYLAAQFLGADYDMISAMSLSGVLLLTEQPWKLMEGGFQISYISILALGLVLPWAKELYKKNKKKDNKEETEIISRIKHTSRSGFRKRWNFYSMHCRIEKLKEALLASIIISAVTAPAMMAVFYEWAPCSILLNLIFLPCMEPLMIFAVCGGLIGLLLQEAGMMLLLPARGILLLFQGIFSVSEHLPVRTIITGCPRPWQMAGIYLLEILLFLLWIHSGTVHRILILTVLCTICTLEQDGSLSLLASLSMPPGTMTIHMLDVGQGESILIRTPNRECLLIDGGSTTRSRVGQYVILPALKYYGVKNLDYVIATHMDEDHISGIQELFAKKYGIKCILLPDAGKDDKAWQSFYKASERTGAMVKTIKCGDGIRLHALSFRCLHPVKDYNPEDRNDTSVVLYLSYHQFGMLFTGDLGEEGEQIFKKLLISKTGMSAMTRETSRSQSYRQMIQELDVLKVAHHGSKYSTAQDFLDLFPQLKTAMISAGRNNRYGHPHKELVERLAAKEIKVWVTKESGAVSLETDGKGYRMRSFLSHND